MEYTLEIKLTTGGGVGTFWEAKLVSDTDGSILYDNAYSLQALINNIQDTAEEGERDE